MSDDRHTTPPAACNGGAPAASPAVPCPDCAYWSQDHTIDYNGPDSKFVTSTQIAPVDVAFRLGANLASGNITITSIVKWGTFAADVTEAMKTATITKFKEKAASWSGKFSVKVTDPVCGEKTLPINYRLLWSPTDIADAAPYSLNLYKTYPRAGVTGWNIDFGYDNSVVAASGWELAHEYGHTLCLPDEYFYAGVTAASVVYKKADGTSETITLQPATGNIMYLHSDTTYLKRFFYFTAVEAQELLRSRSGRNVICEVV